VTHKQSSYFFSKKNPSHILWKAFSSAYFLFTVCLFMMLHWAESLSEKEINKLEDDDRSVDASLLLSGKLSFRCQFHQRSTYNFYARGAQKRKMTMLTWLSIFARLGSTSVKAVRRMLIKLSFRFQFQQHFTQAFLLKSALCSFSLITVWLHNFFVKGYIYIYNF